MPEEWTGDIKKMMHNKQITYDVLAEKLGVTKAYISMILKGKRKPAGARERIEAAMNELVTEA